MQLLTRTFTRAVSNTGNRKKIGNCSTNIPRDPLNASRLELESLLPFLDSLHQNSQWFLVTAYHFATRPEYVSKLAAAANQAVDTTSSHIADLDTLATGLRQHGRTEFDEAKRLLSIIENLVVEIEECLAKFAGRREVFQSAVHCQLKIKKLDMEISKYEDQDSVPVSLVKDLEKQKRKVEQLKSDFRSRNAALKAEIEKLLGRAKPLSMQILGALLQHETSLYDRLTNVSRSFKEIDHRLDMYKGAVDLLASAMPSEVQEPSSDSPNDPYTFLSSRVGRRLIPAPSAAQLILLTGRQSKEHEYSPRGKGTSCLSDESVTKCPPSAPREARASGSSGVLDVDDACVVSDKRPVIVPLLRLSGANGASEEKASPVSSKAKGTTQ